MVDRCLFGLKYIPSLLNSLRKVFLNQIIPITFNPELENLAQLPKLCKEIRLSVGYGKIRFGLA